MIEENLSLILKSIQEINNQIDKQQMIMKYIEGIVRDDISTGKKTESAVSHTKGTETNVSEISEGSKKDGRNDEEKTADWSKFKKMEMPVFNGTDLDSWLFRINRYFKIHELTDSEKSTVAVINFDELALDWYRSNDELERFKNWEDLKQRPLV